MAKYYYTTHPKREAKGVDPIRWQESVVRDTEDRLRRREEVKKRTERLLQVVKAEAPYIGPRWTDPIVQALRNALTQIGSAVDSQRQYVQAEREELQRVRQMPVKS